MAKRRRFPAGVRALFVSPRRRRELNERFTRDMRALRRRLDDPHPTESNQVFLERIFDEFQDTLERYEELFGIFRKPGPPGRPKSLSRAPKRPRGRPAANLAARVAAEALRTGRPVTQVAREVFAGDLHDRDPRRFRSLAFHLDVEREKGSRNERALAAAFAAEPFRKEFQALVRSARNHLNRQKGKPKNSR